VRASPLFLLSLKRKSEVSKGEEVEGGQVEGGAKSKIERKNLGVVARDARGRGIGGGTDGKISRSVKKPL